VIRRVSILTLIFHQFKDALDLGLRRAGEGPSEVVERDPPPGGEEPVREGAEARAERLRRPERERQDDPAEGEEEEILRAVLERAD